MSLPRVYDYFIDNERYYLVMDFIDGCDLDNLIRSNGKPGLPQEEVVKWGIQICEVLDYLHNSNPPIIYRDLKPSNIMLKNSNRKIVLIDFGIACALEDNTSGNPRTMIGTMGYIAPEQYLGKPVPASDIYSLGGTLYNLLTGSMPVPFSYKHMTSIVPEIATGIEEIVCRSLNLKVEERYQSAREVKTVLEKVLESEILTLRTIKEKPKLSRWKVSGELPELSDILSNMESAGTIITVEQTGEKDTKEMKDARGKLNDVTEIDKQEEDRDKIYDVTEIDKQEEDRDKKYIDILEELINTDHESLVKTLQSKEKYLDERFFEIFDHTIEYVASEDENLAKELNNLDKIMASMNLRKRLTEEEDIRDADELFDENFIETSVEDYESHISSDRDLAEYKEELFDEDFIETSSEDNPGLSDMGEENNINRDEGFAVSKEELFDEDFIEDDVIPVSPDIIEEKGKKEKLFDEDFIDFSVDKEEKFKKNLSEKGDTFDEDFIGEPVINEINEEFTEENIEEIFSPSEFIHRELSEQFNRELQEEDYLTEEANAVSNDNINSIQVKDDYNILNEEHIEEYNIKDHMKTDMAYDMLEEEMIISDSLWETEDETIDLSFDDDVIELNEHIIKAVETGSKQVSPSDNISIKIEGTDYIHDNAQKYFEEAQNLIKEELFEEAVSLCEKALDYNGEFLEVHYTLGTIYKKINRSDLAVESYKKYLALKQKKTAEKISKKK